MTCEEVKVQKIYRAKDGMPFTSAEECTRYEAACDWMKEHQVGNGQETMTYKVKVNCDFCDDLNQVTNYFQAIYGNNSVFLSAELDEGYSGDIKIFLEFDEEYENYTIRPLDALIEEAKKKVAELEALNNA